MKVPYLLVVGQREEEQHNVSLRLRHRRDEGVMTVDEAAERIVNAVVTRSLEL
jgi:threonyl-tRNA synthetase